MHNFNISIFYKGLQTIKVTFFILLFLFVPPFLSPLCLPVVFPRGGDPNAKSRGERFPRADIRVIPRQEAKPPGKTSELSFLGHRWRNCLLSWANSDVFPGGFASCLGITLIDVAYFG